MNLYYFGFGANKDPEMMQAIVGRSLQGRPAFIEGFDLVIQSLDDIAQPARSTLRRGWGDVFQSYAMTRGSHRVYGMLWQVTQEDLAHLAEWELEGQNWFKQIQVMATIQEGGSTIPAVTQIIEEQPYQRVVTEKDYSPFPVPKEQLLETARKVREGLM